MYDDRSSNAIEKYYQDYLQDVNVQVSSSVATPIDLASDSSNVVTNSSTSSSCTSASAVPNSSITIMDKLSKVIDISNPIDLQKSALPAHSDKVYSLRIGATEYLIDFAKMVQLKANVH